MTFSMMNVAAQEGLGTIGLNRPKANAYTIGLMREFNQAIDQMESDESVRAVIIQSDVPRFFCAGADISTFDENDTDTNKVLVDLAQRATAKIESSGKIYIAAIAGHALGGGLEIALACDIRLGAEGSYFLGLPEIKLGLIPGNGGSQRLTRVVGEAKSLEMCLTGESIQPDEAYRIGLLNQIFSSARFTELVFDFASKLALGPPLAMSAAKRAVVAGAQCSLQDALALETQLVDTLYNTKDADEGFTAHLEKRPPKFTGQ